MIEFESMSEERLAFFERCIEAARMLKRVEKAGDCWIWLGAQMANGYGYMNRRVGPRKHFVAHRHFYELFIGPIPDGLVIDHLCRVRLCVNPNHLQPVTLTENTRRGMSPIAVAGRSDRCVHGHLFDEINTLVTKEGYRDCRTCHRIGEAGRKLKKKTLAV